MVALIINHNPSQYTLDRRAKNWLALTDIQNILTCYIIVRQTLVVAEFVSLPCKYWLCPFAQSGLSDGILQTGDFGGWVDFHRDGFAGEVTNSHSCGHDSKETQIDAPEVRI